MEKIADYGFAYFSAFKDIFLDLALLMFIGFLLAAIVEEFVSEDRLLKHFGANNFASLIRAAMVGFIISACSCGAIPLVATLRDKGASTATTLTFLLASPWLGIPMLLVFVSYLGLTTTLILILLSITVAIATGSILAVLERRGTIAQGMRYMPVAEKRSFHGQQKANSSSHTDQKEKSQPSLFERILKHIPAHMWELAKDIGKYLLIGIFIAAAIKAFVPLSIVRNYLSESAGIGSVFIAVPAAAIIEACSEGFAVIAGQLYEMGASLAVVFVITMVGVATDVTELLVVWKKFGRRTTLVYLGIGTCLTIVMGVIIHFVIV